MALAVSNNSVNVKLTLYVEEYYLLTEAIVVLRTDDVFSSVLQASAVDDEVIVVSGIPLNASKWVSICISSSHARHDVHSTTLC